MTDSFATRPRRARWGPLLTAALLTLAAACDTGEAAPAGTADGTTGHAVVLLYHHVAADTPPSTSVTPDTFERHLDYLADNGYRVLPLSRIVEALADPDAEPLPPRAVAITFDDAYESVYTEAAPRLDRHDMPYAVFVSTDYIDQGYGNYMSWDQLRELEQGGGEMANHSRDHGHYVHRRPGEREAEWRKRIARDIESAQERLTDELTAPLEVLAYPYGEFDPALTELARQLGFVAFGQQSGPVGPGSDLQALPRFPMASGYADVDALAEKLRTRPFRVEVRSDVGPVLAPDAGAPTLRLRLAAGDARLDALSCFVTGQDRPTLRWVDREGGVVEITASRALPVGRSKYTCTAPSTAGGGVFFWYSHLWMKPPAAGEWYPD
jgi:peptidoglycan/xylan/chitin deacetylase (PgdA/CDA1 family)